MGIPHHPEQRGTGVVNSEKRKRKRRDVKVLNRVFHDQRIHAAIDQDQDVSVKNQRGRRHDNGNQNADHHLLIRALTRLFPVAASQQLRYHHRTSRSHRRKNHNQQNVYGIYQRYAGYRFFSGSRYHNHVRHPDCNGKKLLYDHRHDQFYQHLSVKYHRLFLIHPYGLLPFF